MPLSWMKPEHRIAAARTFSERLKNEPGFVNRFVSWHRNPRIASESAAKHSLWRKTREGQEYTKRAARTVGSNAVRAKMSLSAKKRAAEGRNPIIGMKLPEKDTKPELAVQRALLLLGCEFETHIAIPGNSHLWDVALIGKKTLIEVDGCYWHGCAACGYETSKRAKPDRDRQLDVFAQQAGWKVIRIWEHNISTVPETAHILEEML